ncbi:MAG: hypothetical protein PHR06_05860 [Candidatus Cloacimonetes bacterium]|nr:hypothetical protein [Candidatus Cloacimonadota bacterium]
MRKIFSFVLIFSIVASILSAGTLEKRIESLGKENAKLYLQPMINSFGANLNSGFYNTAKVLGTLKFGFFVNGSLTFVPTGDKKFTLNTDGVPAGYIGATETATVLGDEGATLTYQDNSLKLPNGADISAIPFAMPQLHVGIPFGNELMLRFTPTFNISEDIGSFHFWGIGLKHSISQYIPLIPIDLAVQGVYQQMKVGDILEFNATAFNAQISKTILMWTLYGGLGYEMTNMKAEYEYLPIVTGDDAEEYLTPLKVNLEMESENDIRATVGFRYSILLAKFYADYSICKYPVLNIGVGLSL